jgi:protein ImuA
VLACFEEGLRHRGLGAVVAEVARLSMTASRRLQLAAEGTGTIGIAIRRWRRQTEAADFGQPTAAVTRWRVFVSAHDGQHAHRLRGVCWIIGAALHVGRVVIDFEEVGLSLNLEAAEVVLAVRIVLGIEVDECAHPFKNGCIRFNRERTYSRRNQYATTDE